LEIFGCRVNEEAQISISFNFLLAVVSRATLHHMLSFWGGIAMKALIPAVVVQINGGGYVLANAEDCQLSGITIRVSCPE